MSLRALGFAAVGAALAWLYLTREKKPKRKIFKGFVDAVGHTPIVRLNELSGLKEDKKKKSNERLLKN